MDLTARQCSLRLCLLCGLLLCSLCVATLSVVTQSPATLQAADTPPRLELPAQSVLPTQLTWNPTTHRLSVHDAAHGDVWEFSPIGELLARRKQPFARLIGPTGFVAAAPDGTWTALVDPWQPRLRIAPATGAGLAKLTVADCRQIAVAQHPQALAITPDSKTILVACDPPGQKDRQVHLVDVATGQSRVRMIPGSSNLRGLAVDPQGKYALAVHLRPKSQLPSTQIEQGWVFTNAVSWLSLTDETVVSLPLDLRTQGFANPEAVVISPDGRWAYIAHGGADLVSVVDLPRLKQAVDSVRTAGNQAAVDAGTYQADDLRLTRRYVRARIAVGPQPRALALTADGKTLFVANRLGNSVSVIDTARRQVVRTIALSTAVPDLVRKGEILFHSARLSFGGQFSCASCHPDSQSDGLNWDLPADGFSNFQNTKTLLGIQGTAPYGWLGTTPTLAERFSGTLRHLFQHSPTADETRALVAYLEQLRYPAELPRRRDPQSPEVLRGQALFTGTGGCVDCHSGPQYTDRALHDIGLDEDGTRYDTPSLLRVSETAPYLHDGRAGTLAEIFGTYNTRNLHGNAGELSPAELQDLLAFLESL